MREIKFRYWCTFERKMYDKAYVEEHLNLAFMSELLEAAQERYVFQQYTGLKDKNGQEIYEGDIVKGKAYEFNGCPRIIGEVVYDYCEFKVKSIRDKTSKMKAELNTTYEVIGNIYENPELLEKSS